MCLLDSVPGCPDPVGLGALGTGVSKRDPTLSPTSPNMA